MYLAQRADLRGEGITLSGQQATHAAHLIAEAGVGDRVRCRQGDYLSVPDDLSGSSDLTFSIEAFIHGPDARGYFRQAARTLRPGGTLVLCDDFLAATALPTSQRATQQLDDFRTGWHVGSLLTVDQVRELAAEYGLVLTRDLDLTPELELRRPRDRWISALVTCGRLVRPTGPVLAIARRWRCPSVAAHARRTELSVLGIPLVATVKRDGVCRRRHCCLTTCSRERRCH